MDEVEIDWSDVGMYMPSSVSLYPSRLLTALRGSFLVSDITDCSWVVIQRGHPMHVVKAFSVCDRMHMSCTCYDFSVYGAAFHRACIHIWRAAMVRPVEEC